MATTPPSKRKALQRFLDRNSQTKQAYTPRPGVTPPQRARSAQDVAAAQYAPATLRKKSGLPGKRRFSNTAPYARY